LISNNDRRASWCNRRRILLVNWPLISYCYSLSSCVVCNNSHP